MVAYFCNHLSDNYVDLSYLYVGLSVIYITYLYLLLPANKLFEGSILGLSEINFLRYFAQCFSDKNSCHSANDCGDCGESGVPVCHHNLCSCESKEYIIKNTNMRLNQ